MMTLLPHNYIIDDDNRVVLQPSEGHEHEFVNASYVDVSMHAYTVVGYDVSLGVCYIFSHNRDTAQRESSLLVKVWKNIMHPDASRYTCRQTSLHTQTHNVLQKLNVFF